ncbi:MG2 domain-containing protein [uncultured Polaribacter sp.]|uniref:alpha-2-macroglobulin family protein n=1 Tax=uncultured Polaribacter sp. TaxID=174711 RepID=UPI00262F6086|nr:MG2 domain-containing protein [uncultured Polaribacter sp.]
MKNTILAILVMMLFSLTTNSQNNFDTLWKKVEKLEVDNLPKSALKIVEDIYTKATNENNTPQLIKSLFYKSKFSLTLEEDAQLKIISSFKKHISESEFPTKNVLENVLANLYWQYFNQNRYKFYNRTSLENTSSSSAQDFRTWDLNTLFKEIHLHFKTSLKDEQKLQKINIGEFSEILQLEKNSKIYSPTLYDFLANNALKFYKSSETSITRPSYKFTIDNSDFLCDAQIFSTLKITSKDSLSLQLNALKTYQKVIAFHLKEDNKNALAAIDIERLQFVRKNAIFENKAARYLETLQDSKEAHKKHESVALYAFEIAKICKEKAESYKDSKDKTAQFKNREALEICNEIITKYPKSLGAKKCTVLKAKIKEKRLSIQAEHYVPIQTHSRLLISYKNIDKLFFKAFKITEAQLENYQKIYKVEEKIKFINKFEIVKKWNETLRNENDYLSHTTEVIVPKFDNGMYLILASETASLDKNIIFGATPFQATNLALIHNTFNNIHNYQIVDRVNGAPIKNAEIHLQNKQKQRGGYINKKLITNKNGFATYKSYNYFQNVTFSVKTKNDVAKFGNQFLRKNEKQNNIQKERSYLKPFIFTDRSIYRPGQTVYFKAIVLKKLGENSAIFIDEFVEVVLKDVNNQVVKTLHLKLNEFGSISGEFIIPNNGLTGNFSVEINKSSARKSKYNYKFDYGNSAIIAVEEYKRPKFKTEFKPITESIKLNDSVLVKGFAKSFSGANITDANVVYRVHRKVQYPAWYSWRRPIYNSSSQEITNGESTTNAKGEFEILFKAIPDKTVSKENLPIFTYEVTADVTDVNGETRSATTIVKVGYHSLVATIAMDEKIAKNEKETTIKVETKNLNGEFVPAKGIVKIYKLLAPQNPLRDSPWNAPDYQDISEREFRRLFPNDAYLKHEEDANTWKKGQLVFSKKFDTKVSKEIQLENTKNWPLGKYIAILESEDTFGQAVKDEKRFSLYSTKGEQVADNKLFVINTNKTNYKVGDIVELQVGSASKDMTVVVQIEKNHTIIETRLLKLNNSTKTIKIPVNKEDLGGFAVKYHYVNFNDFKSGSLFVKVIEKQLSPIAIETNIFRDKLQPGAEEKWSFTIKNDEKDTMAAEMLASMYDASLDEFRPHNWQFNPISKKRTYYSYETSTAKQSFGTNRFQMVNNRSNYNEFPSVKYPNYNWYGFQFGRNQQLYLRGNSRISKVSNGQAERVQMVSDEMEESSLVSPEVDAADSLDEIVVVGYGKEKEQEKISFDGVQIRKNFQETAFFFPQLRTDKNGKVSFSFTMPEALTRWKLQLLAHTKDLKSATKTLQTVTQKELMVVPNAPRFLREKDTISLSAKITNLTNNQLSGFAKLILTDAISGKEITQNLLSKSGSLPLGEMSGTDRVGFSVDKDGNANVSWSLSIPETVQAVQYKIVAKAGDFSDGEQNVLPVLSNRMLVTETLPMWVRSNQTKTFTLDKLKQNSSSTLKNHKLTLEMTSNPVWYAIQSLPYLMEYPYECSEQIFARYYANTLASFVANSNPRIQGVFNAWKSSDALLSNLEKNQELKSLIIQETPWLRDAQSETEQKKRIALLFDLNKMKNEQQKAIHKLKNIQMNSGGFSWFKGGRYENNFITQHIATGFGHLQKLGVSEFDQTTKTMLEKAVKYLDKEIVTQYQKILQNASKIKAEKGNKKYEDYLAKNHLNYFTIQYLYMRSFYDAISKNDKTKTAISYYQNQSQKYWNDYNIYAKGQIALSLFRNDKKAVANKILKSLKENSITSDELGMYWKSNTAGYYYYQAPVETQALMIEVFSEILEADIHQDKLETIDNLKIWLLKNKQTNRWKTTKATTEAVYALLLNGSNWVSITEMVDITIGDKKINPTAMENVKVEAGTGYFKTSWNGNEIIPNMSEVTINKKGDGIAWGGLYWQYFEDLDKITSAKTPLKLNKKLFLKVNSDTGKELKEINSTTNLKVGDLITIRIALHSDRDLEFIHMKDMRASGVEPINVLSRYKWQDNLGYYESTKDAATNFFFDRLPKGVYAFEYDVRVNNAGNFSNGITTIQSMYAPEFSSHSKGIRLKINN